MPGTPSTLHRRWKVRHAAWLARLLRRQEGQGLVEYGLILALVALVAIAGLTTFGLNVAGMASWDVTF